MAESHVVTSLTAKRAEMAGLIEHHHAQIARLSADLKHLDATLKLFAPGIDLRTVKAKSYREPNQFFKHGDGPRTVLDVLRRAGCPLTSRELGEAILSSNGQAHDEAALISIQKSVLVVLRRLVANGTVSESTGQGKARTWAPA